MLKTNTISDTRKAKVLLYSLKKRISILGKLIFDHKANIVFLQEITQKALETIKNMESQINF